MDVVISFNDGNILRLKVLKELGIEDCGQNTINALKSLDVERLRTSDRVALEASKEARLAKKRANVLQEPADPLEYDPGAY